MSSDFGKTLRITIFGESHGRGIGCVIDGLPAGERIDREALHEFMARRAPGSNPLATPRKEADVPVWLSGVVGDLTTGSPLCAIIENHDQHSADYEALQDKPRPGHADYTAHIKWQGQADMRGGGHFSGRLTAPLCIAGGIAKQILARRGIFVGAHLASVGTCEDDSFPMLPNRELFAELGAKPFPVLDDRAGDGMKQTITLAAADGDSIGGTIECMAIGLPAGLGSPMFDGVENRLAAALFGIPAVKGLEFGSGFSGSTRRGSANNDPFTMENGKITALTNHAGGILGGISTGLPIRLRVAIKPTPSIKQPQATVSLSRMEDTELIITGRHDPCIALRAVPVVEAVTAAVLLDLLLEESHHGLE